MGLFDFLFGESQLTKDYKQSFDLGLGSSQQRLDLALLDKESSAFLSKYRKLFQDLIDYQQTSRQTEELGKMPYVHFDFIKNPIINAMAFSVGEKEFIGFNYGIVLVLYSIFNRLLAHKDVLPLIGNPDKEIENPPLKKLSINYNDYQIEHNDGQLMPEIYPKDYSRRKHAVFLTNLALFFMLEHEIAHLRYGHYELFKKLSGRTNFIEFDNAPQPGVPILTRKTLEWDADSWASSMAFWRLYQLWINKTAETKLLSKYNSIQEGLYQSWSFSIWVLFRLMDIGSKNMGKTPLPYYPTPDQRLYTALVTFGTKSIQNTNVTSITFLNKYNFNFATNAEKSLSLISNHKADLSGIINVSELNKQGKMPTWANELTSHWKKVVRPALLPYTRAVDLAD